MDNVATAHAAAERLAAFLTVAGIAPRDIAEALTTTGLALMAADHPQAAVVLTGDFYEVTDGR